jgi:alkanesulfonate monooxygenase SsuD/methylene tetrahydromethanopterin reductase-like flavin-dependent oxidoreductase (luciferase family)
VGPLEESIGGASPAAFRDISTRLDALIVAAGREPRAVKRTLMQQVICYRTEAELGRQVGWLATQTPGLAGQSPSAILNYHRTRSPNVIAGSPDQVIEQIHAYGAAGVDEIMVQRMDLDDMEGLQIIAEEVITRL